MIDADITADGKLHRVHVEGDKTGTRNGWYVLHSGDFPAGAFGCNRRGISGKWRSQQKHQHLNRYDREQIDEQLRARVEAREQYHSAAAARAWQILQRATRDASEHPYCARKRVEAHGVKCNGSGLIVIPIYSALNGLLQTVQFIASDGSKKMLTGGRLATGCFPFQDVPDFWAKAQRRIGIGEGWATCATLAESLPETAIFASFSAGNLIRVAMALRARYDDAAITIYGDNDVNGVGQRCASATASAIGGLLAIPPASGDDWNDHAVRGAA